MLPCMYVWRCFECKLNIETDIEKNPLCDGCGNELEHYQIRYYEPDDYSMGYDHDMACGCNDPYCQV